MAAKACPQSTPSEANVRLRRIIEPNPCRHNQRHEPAGFADAWRLRLRLELALFADLGGLADAVTQVVELRPANIALGYELELGHDW